MRSHAPVWGHNREAVIQYIRVGREVMEPLRNRKFNGGGDQGSHGGHWVRSRGNGTRNSEGQNHGNGAVFGGGQGGQSGGRDGNNGGGGGVQGVNGNNTNPPLPPPIREENAERRSELSVRRYVGVEGLIDWGNGGKYIREAMPSRRSQ